MILKPVKKLLKIRSSASIDFARTVKELQSKGQDVVDLTWGEPDLPPPSLLLKAAGHALKTRPLGYTDSRGLRELRYSLVKSRSYRKLNYNPEKEILITPGAKQAIFYALQVLVEKGDEVLLFDPYWTSYADQVWLSGARPAFVRLDPERNFDFSYEDVEKKVSSKTKVIIFNNPSNPTGRVYDSDKLKIIAEIAKAHNLVVVSDEIYDQILFEGGTLPRLSQMKGMRDRTLVVNGFSKTYSMTGWRLGYMFGPSSIIKLVHKVHQHSATCASALSQWVALAILKTSRNYIDKNVQIYESRRKILNRFNEEGPFKLALPEGTFYAFLDGRKMNMSSVRLAQRLLEVAGVAMVPGSAYGKSGEGFLRLSFAIKNRILSKAVDRILNQVHRLKT